MTDSRSTSTIVPPVARRIDHREERHGEMVMDPYQWLRDKTNQEVIGYLEAENAYTAAMTKEIEPFAEELYNEMLGRIKQTDLSVPVRRGGYFYYSRTEEGKQYSIHCRRPGSMEAAEEILLDLNDLAQGLPFLSLGAFEISDNGQLLAYSTDTTGYRQYKLFVKDLKTGAVLADTVDRVTSVEWSADNRTLFLTTEDSVTKRSDRLWRHRLGTPGLEPLYHEADELYRIGLSRTRDLKYVMLTIRSTDTSEVRYVRADAPESDWNLFLARAPKHRYSVDHREGLFYVRSNREAKNFRILTVEGLDPRPENWKVFVEHRADVLNLGVDLFRDFAVVVEQSNALVGMRFFDFRCQEWGALEFPEPVYAAGPGATPEYDTHVYRYSYQSFVTPPSVFDYDMDRRESTLLKQQEVLGGYDPTQYASERIWATGRDGVKVPLSVMYRRGFEKNGASPLLLYGYGSYGHSVPAGFSSARLSLLDRGMAFVIAHIRGGDDMGESWHDDGMLMKKRNTFFDFIDAAEFLIAEKWTCADQLAIQGGSAGGLLIGAVVNLRPELFHAAHLAVPFVDVVNTMLDASLPLTVGEYLEWGNPNEKAAYDYMRSYSPYDNLAARSYPAMLVTTSLNDSQVGYWEPAKYVAKLRTLKTDDRPLLLKVNLGAGHGGASGRYDRLKEMAFEYAWLLRAVSRA